MCSPCAHRVLAACVWAGEEIAAAGAARETAARRGLSEARDVSALEAARQAKSVRRYLNRDPPMGSRSDVTNLFEQRAQLDRYLFTSHGWIAT